LDSPPGSFIPPGFELPVWEHPPRFAQQILLDALRPDAGRAGKPVSLSLSCTLVHGRCRIHDAGGREHDLEELLELSTLLQEIELKVMIHMKVKRVDPILSADQREILMGLVFLAYRARKGGREASCTG
jgi:hypothetical protein